MADIWFQAALWLGLALVATLLSAYLHIATALSEIVVGTIAQLFIGALVGAGVLAGVYPVSRFYGASAREGMYTTLLMSTGLTFGTISALFGLSHQLISPAQYSSLVAAVIGSAVIPTLIANAFFLPRHLLPASAAATPEAGKPVQPRQQDADKRR